MALGDLSPLSLLIYAPCVDKGFSPGDDSTYTLWSLCIFKCR